ncbi:protein ALP1-like [Lolium perenne]|uniref:protein ALP1-like n=1 Tax=Lolium perenne TaxID=4522 RepID=UPI0021E9F901|nr:protein ALP1-like [Lolium perenne]
MSTYVTPFTPIPSFFDAPAVGADYDQSSLMAFLMNDDFTTDALFAYADNTPPTTAPPAPTFSAAPLQPPAPPAPTSHGRKRALTPTAADEPSTAGASRSATLRRKTSPPTSPATSGGDPSPPSGRGGGRRVWVRERSTEWWDRLSSPTCPDPEFRAAFRMSRATFDALCDDLSAAVAKEDTALRAAIPVHQRVAVCLWRLATGEPLREVSRRFGLGISTCHNIVLQVCAALTTVLLPRTIRWPHDLSFHNTSGIPGVVGALCTDHIPIGPPKDGVADYYNRRLTERNTKASYSVAVQAVVAPDGAFTDISIGLPGSLSDAAVLDRSALHSSCQSGALGPHHRLVGGKSYPLTDWMLVPYAHRNLTWAQHAFNERVAAARAAAQDAFRNLKARWRCLQRRAEHKLPDLHNMIGACCVLHNFCQRSGEEIDPELLVDLDNHFADEVVAAQPVRSAAAEKERDRIAHDLLHGGHAVTFF